MTTSAPPALPPPVSYDVLESAKRHREQVRRECDRVGAFSYSEQQSFSLVAIIEELYESLSAARREHRKALFVAVVTKARLIIFQVCAGPDTPSFVVSLVSMVAASAMAFVACMLLQSSVGVATISIAGSAIVTFSLTALFLTQLPVENAEASYHGAQKQLTALATSIPRYKRLLRARQDQLTKLQEAARLRAEYLNAEAREKEIEQAYNDRRNLLQLEDWENLRGIPFEHFLNEVFQALGYRVEATKASGDHGIDLIVEKNGDRLGIQAKGYEGSVGNGAV